MTSWRVEFHVSLYFYHGLFNSCGVLIGFLGKLDGNILIRISDNKGHILIFDITTNAKNFVSINLCNPNNENDQAEVLNPFLTVMETVDKKEKSKLLLARDFNVFLIQL